MNTPYKHNARSFFDIYNPLVQAYKNKPTWLFEEMAGLFDFASELMNRIATDILDPVTRESVYAFAARFDYTPVEADGCAALVRLTLREPMEKTLPAGYQVAGVSSITGELVLFELLAPGYSNGTDHIEAQVKQKESKKNITIGTVDKQIEYMDFPIDGHVNIIRESISLTINSQLWTRVDNFDHSGQDDHHFKLVYQSNGKSRILFSNGVNGQKPQMNSIIYADFAVTKGLQGIMDAGEISINTGGDVEIIQITNPAPSQGGNNSESIQSIKRNAPANIRLRDMVWSVEDLELAAMKANSSVLKALGQSGPGRAVVYIVPTNGGEPSVSIKEEVQTYIVARSQFGVMPVAVKNPLYRKVAISANITVRPGYDRATAREITRFAMVLTSSAIDIWVLEYFTDNGVEACRRNIINVCTHPAWGFAFTEDENEALFSIITAWINILGNKGFRQFGQALEVGDLWIMGNSLYKFGIDEFALTSPLINTEVGKIEIIDTDAVTVDAL